MTLRNCQPNPARTVGTFVRLCHRADTENGAQTRLHAVLSALAFVAGSGLRGDLIYDLGIPRDIC